MKEKNRRIIMTVIGVLILGFSIGIFNFSAFGMGPFQVFVHGLWRHIPMGYGVFYMILNLIILIFIFFIDRHKIGLGTVVNIFLLGYVVEYTSLFFDRRIPNPSIWVRTLFLIVGIIILCLGVSLYIIGDLGISPYDSIALILSEKKVAPFQYCRIGTDLISTIIGFLLGETVGIGTLATAFFMGPIVDFFNKRISIPLRYSGKN
ncbi:MAG: hypothetical protein EWM47_07915 [Anaerolineaceae bacterium]|nr:MAG: hypothetical protein EWM47_07915 [Anaerolineaceae bacterium]